MKCSTLSGSFRPVVGQRAGDPFGELGPVCGCLLRFAGSVMADRLRHGWLYRMATRWHEF